MYTSYETWLLKWIDKGIHLVCLCFKNKKIVIVLLIRKRSCTKSFGPDVKTALQGNIKIE
jgi:hypothetical protein